MSGKIRELPSWMTMKHENVKVKRKLTNLTSGEKKTTRKRVGRTVYYCLNESELVDAAIVYLTSDAGEPFHQQVSEDSASKTTCVKAMDTVAKRKRRRVSVLGAVEQSYDSGAQENTHVSETDDDVETIPYTGIANADRQETEGHSGPVTSAQDSQTEEESSQIPAATHDDALKLVREIFFT